MPVKASALLLKLKIKAKQIIIASNYQLDFESIYGAIEDV